MKSVLMMYKVFLRYPEALRPAFPKLKEKLEDPDPGTVAHSPHFLLIPSEIEITVLFNYSQVFNRPQ